MNSVYIDYDVLQIIKDFTKSAKERKINVKLKNFKRAYKMEDSVHVHSEQDEPEAVPS